MRDDVRQLVDKGPRRSIRMATSPICVRENDDADTLGKALDLIKAEGLKAGIGRPFAQEYRAQRRTESQPGLLRQDAAYRPLLVGDARGEPQGVLLADGAPARP